VSQTAVRAVNTQMCHNASLMLFTDFNRQYLNVMQCGARGFIPTGNIRLVG